MSNLISLQYFSAEEINQLIDLTKKIKENPSKYSTVLKDKYIGLLFEKPSLRTKTAFYVGSLQLGAQAIYYTPTEVKLGEREKISDVARTLSSYLDAVVLRTFSHQSVLEFTRFSSVPVINGLSDLFHPSQALADIFTILELKSDIKKLKIAYIGDGNNVCNSLIYCISILGGNLVIANPKGYQPSKEVLYQAETFCSISDANIDLFHTSEEAASEADVLYTDVWTSMGNEGSLEERKKAFKNFQINDKILSLAKKDSIIMHCLPAHRGEEITDSVIDSDQSVVFLQAENRLHTAKAILYYLFNKE